MTKETEFPPIDKAAWLRQVTADLKGKPIDSITGEWWPGEKIDPFLDASDTPVIVRLPDDWFGSPPRLADLLEPGPAETGGHFNRRILESLRQGTEVLRIRTATGIETDPVAWLADVETPMIDLEWEPTGMPLDGLLSSLSTWPRGIRVILPGHEVMYAPMALARELMDAGYQPVFQFTLPAGTPGIDKMGSVLLQFRRLTQAWQAAFGPSRSWANHVLVEQPADPMYYRQLILSRAIQLVLRGWMEMTNPGVAQTNRPLQITCRRSWDESPEQFLIRASAAALGGFLAGAGQVRTEVDPPGSLPDHFRRAGLHVHHLLAMESQMTKGADPVAGSYALDHYTARWAESLWAAMQGE